MQNGKSDTKWRILVIFAQFNGVYKNKLEDKGIISLVLKIFPINTYKGEFIEILVPILCNI